MIIENKKYIREVLQTQVKESCDVLVIGGGTAGVIAAVAAARQGAKTILVECSPILGGDMLAGGLSWLSFFNVFKQFNAQPKQLLFGMAYELMQRLVKSGGSPGFYDDLGTHTQESRGVHADREQLKSVLYDLTRENGIKLYLNTLMVDTIMEGSTLEGLVLQSKSERFAITAKAIVDTSGDGDVAYRAGASCKEFADQSVGMSFGMANIDFTKALAYGREKNALVHECYGEEDGPYKDKLVKYALRTYFIPELGKAVAESGIHRSFCITISHDGEGSYINGVNMVGGNGLDSEKATDTVLHLRESIKKSAQFLRDYIPGFENAYLTWTSPTVGTRRARYVECDCDISAADVAEGLIPDDSIGLFGSQDAHFSGHVIDGGKWYGIPYRALLPKFVDNLLVAGRMISSDWVAYMSTRLVGSCFLQGQAAGTAAAMAALSGISVRTLDTEKLREALIADGSYLG